MFVLTCEIKIGNLTAKAVNSVVVRRSIHSLATTATIKLPVTAILRQQGEPATKIETATEIKVGDKVEIRLGYDGRNQIEFRGYVKNLNLRTPIEIECEDEFYSCRNRNIKTSGTVTLGDLFEKCGLSVGYAETLTLRNYAVPDKPVSAVLANLKSKYGLSIFFDIEGKIYACRPEQVVSDQVVKYRLRDNVISDDDLQFKRKEDLKIQIKAICIKKDGTRLEATKGAEGGIVETKYYYDVIDTKELATLAQADLDRATYNGYDDTITTFLIPFAAPTMVAHLEDALYAERDGQYYIEGVETTFGTGGGRRRIEIGTSI